MTESREEVCSFLRCLSKYILTVTGGPETSSYMLSTLVNFEDALSDLFPLEKGETDMNKRRPLSKYLYRALHTNAKIVYAICDWCGRDRDPAGVLNHVVEADRLSAHIVRESLDQQRVIYD